jgi:hypothetical protein
VAITISADLLNRPLVSYQICLEKVAEFQNRLRIGLRMLQKRNRLPQLGQAGLPVYFAVYVA